MVLFSILIIIIALLILFYLFIFKRDPKISTPKGDNIIAPTSGKIVGIYNNLETIPKGYLGKVKTLCDDVAKDCTIISIMMTPLDVHYQYAPINGKIISTTYTPGRFLNAVTETSLKTLENENNQILIKGKNNIKVIQIAGFLARRIKCFIKKTDRVIKGQKIGFIDLGSQVTLIIPKQKLRIKLNQKVIGGETIIADGKD
jgi:phosphatidylserine decarboxylase